MRRANEGKVGIVAIVVVAATVYACWKWGVPWAEANFFQKPPAPAQNHDAGGVQDATPPALVPKKTDAATQPATSGGTTEGGGTSATGTQPPPTQPATSADPREAAARKLLGDAKNWEINHRPDTAKAKYEELIEVYKGTQAAEEGKACLKALQSK